MYPVSEHFQTSTASSSTSSAMGAAAASSRPPRELEGPPGQQYSQEIPDPCCQPLPYPNACASAERDPTRSHRLPPPESLVAGVPWAPDPSHFRMRQARHQAPPAHHQDGLGQDAPPSVPSSPLLVPSYNAYSGGSQYRPYQTRSAPNASQTPSQTSTRAHRQSAEETSPADPSLPRFSHQAAALPSPASVPTGHRRQHPIDTRLFYPHPSEQIAPSPASDSAVPPVSQTHSGLQRTGCKFATARVPNLIGFNRSEALTDVSFRLVMRQQPHAARACGFGDRDRRVIDPPPIVQLVISGPRLSLEEVRTYVRYESYVMSCSIYDESGTRDASYMPDEYQNQRRLMGSLIATPFVGQDENHVEGCFFCFSDLSCRTPGTFRLNFILMMIDPSLAGPVKHFPILAGTMSEPFRVYNAKEFPGMLASSRLAKRLKEQGCIISIKKGNEKTERVDRREGQEQQGADEREEETEQQDRHEQPGVAHDGGEERDGRERDQRVEWPQGRQEHEAGSGFYRLKMPRTQDEGPDENSNGEGSSTGARKRRALEIMSGLGLY